MILALRLARRELRGGLTGFQIFIACLALGVAVIAGVGSLSAALDASLRNDARALLGGDVDFHLFHRPASPPSAPISPAPERCPKRTTCAPWRGPRMVARAA